MLEWSGIFSRNKISTLPLLLGCQAWIMAVAAICVGYLTSSSGKPPILPSAIILGQLSVLGFWLSKGPGHHRQRFDSSVVCLGGLTGLIAITAQLTNPVCNVFFLWCESAVAGVVATGGAAVACNAMKVMGSVQLVRPAIPHPKLEKLSFSLRELLLLVAIISVALAVGKGLDSLIEVLPLGVEGLSIICLVSLSCAVSVPPIAWLALGVVKPHRGVSLAVLVPLLSSFVVAAYARPHEASLFTIPAIIMIAASTEATILIALRLLKYRLVVVAVVAHDQRE